MRPRNGSGASRTTSCHSRIPAARKIAPPTAAMITAVPRLGSFSTSATGAATISAGGSRNSGLPIRFWPMRWNQAASASARAILASSDGCSCTPPSTSQRSAPLPTWPILSTAASSSSDKA